MTSLSMTVDHINQHLPASLVSPQTQTALRQVARCLPAAAIDWLYLERHLAADAIRTDLIAGVSRDGFRILAGRCPGTPFELPAGAHPIWHRIQHLCEQCGDAESDVAAAIERIWLEFDVVRTTESHPVPGVFIDFAEAASAAHADVLFGGTLGAATYRALDRIIGSLPTGARVPYYGLFPARAPAALRVCVAGVTTQNLADFLIRSGWPGDANALRCSLAQYRSLEPRVLHLDLAPSLLPSVGIEYVFDARPQIRGGFAEPEFLDALVHAGLCSAMKRDALIAVPGCARVNLAHEFWPSIMMRQLHHVKLVFDGGRVQSAKAYLSFHTRPHTSSTTLRDRAMPLCLRDPLPQVHAC